MDGGRWIVASPITFVVLVPSLIGAALLATWLPARGAAEVEPVEMLRGE